MIIKNTFSIEDYESKNRELHAKLDRREELTKEESAFVCHSLRYENLLLYPFCLDEFFTRSFMARNTDVPNEMFPMRERDHIYYQGLVREWEKTINKTNHSDQLLQIASAETRDELRNLRKRYSVFSRTFSTADYQRRKFQLVEWSKYRYIMIKEIFELSIKSDHYILSLNGHDIIFDYYSLAHILTQHFGHIMKTYETDKTHFTKDIHHQEIHLKLEEIFKAIDESGLYSQNSVEEINIRFNGTIYKIFTDHETNGSTTYLRLNSFFPVDNERMFQRLKEEFEEKKINSTLSIFVKIGS